MKNVLNEEELDSLVKFFEILIEIDKDTETENLV